MTTDTTADAELTAIQQAIYQAAEFLPAQGPITAFVFLNTLQGFEDQSFFDGLKAGRDLFGCEPLLPEARFRQFLEQGRIRPADLDQALRDDLGARTHERIAGLTSRFELRRGMLQYSIHTAPAAELHWFVAETDAITRLRPELSVAARERFIRESRAWLARELLAVKTNGAGGTAIATHVHDILEGLVNEEEIAQMDQWSAERWEAVALQLLWRVCRHGLEGVPYRQPLPAKPLRHCELWRQRFGEDADLLVHEVFIPFCAAFVDQGFAHWQLPHREEGFFAAFVQMYTQSLGPPEPWMRGLPHELVRWQAERVTPLQAVAESLRALGVPVESHAAYLRATLASLRGWSGLIHQLEVRGDRAAIPAPLGSLAEFLAVRLLLDRWALQYVADHAEREQRVAGTLAERYERILAEHPPAEPPGEEQRAFELFQIAQALGWTPPQLLALSREQRQELIHAVEAFDSFERRRIFQLAFERYFRTRALDAVQHYCQQPPQRPATPKFQAAFCIDTREESLRRYIEELEPEAETFGVAGFFGVPIYFRGVADAHFSTLCPIVLRPKHWIVEEPLFTAEEENRRRAATRKAIGSASHQVHVGTRSLASGALLTAGLGVLASVPLVARVLAPQLTARFLRSVGELVNPPKSTRLRLERASVDPAPDEAGYGFSLNEMADMSERTLRDMGLTSNFARLVLFFGHGSYCLNNPHKSCYDCGACSGGAGGPNARALAAMLNDQRVRAVLYQRGLEIPKETYFLGGLHNTCSDTFTFFDLDLLPATHFRDFSTAKECLEQAAQRNAHERCRRFYSARLDLSYAAAHRHVEGRSEDLAQTRPEFGNATNGLCFVGRRGRTRGLYLDRRCFLVSYDPEGDDPLHTILGRILGAVVPVCEGINLQYYFSYVDSPGWGSGTKLPHNVAALLGVMDGAVSDMRFGLPWQGVEIHEPMRLLFVIESPPEGIEAVMQRNALVAKIIRNGWVQVASLHPTTHELRRFKNGDWVPYQPETAELPIAESSLAWYRGRRDHLPFAALRNAIAAKEGATP